ncbi:related to Protein GET1 [Moesziomyces antarcticus]|uniref:Related to Protein GET1 n=1 Tax=Pseudozyma antarctica TaxID=84753 RepID=A0A5C3FG50_PSEA2|nr:related to Protein GET1 [Moesziomyces antarcticus]
MHPAVVIFVSVVVVQCISALGKERLQEALWFVFASIFHRGTLSSQRALRKEIYSTKQELAATSSQDQFAKWAKLRRRVDKGLADLERTNADVARAKSTFGMLFKAVMFVITTVVPFCVTSWYSKTPIFWLPPTKHSWFGPVGWFLALPRAPKGAISSTVWQMVCSRTIIALASALTNLVPGKKEEVLVEKPESQPAQSHEKTQAKTSATQAGAQSDTRKRTNAQSASEKTEL